MNEFDEIKELLSDVIDEDDFWLSLIIYSLYVYEPNINYEEMALQFRERLMKGYQDE